MSGVYNIINFCGDCKSVAQGYCDAKSGGGGWLVVQRRKDESVSFDRGWAEYEEGFGDLNGEFWYGLKPLHCLTSQGQWELRIDLTHTNGTKTYLHYKNFAIESASDKYPLQISQFSGIYPVPSAQLLQNMKFTTKDSDNDEWSQNCASYQNSNRWWHKHCSFIRLNTEYSTKQTIFVDHTIRWLYYPFVEMKIKPTICS